MGLWGMLEVFLDTIVCCTLTALAILVSHVDYTTLDSTTLVIESFKNGLGSVSSGFVSVAIALFAFATLIGWSVCGETCSQYLFGDGGTIMYRVAYIVSIILGATLDTSSVWVLSDIFNGLMAIPNLLGIMLLSRNFKPNKT
jgi:AGCS family alanine or glycine:cation symporter